MAKTKVTKTRAQLRKEALAKGVKKEPDRRERLRGSSHAGETYHQWDEGDMVAGTLSFKRIDSFVVLWDDNVHVIFLFCSPSCVADSRTEDCCWDSEARREEVEHQGSPQDLQCPFHHSMVCNNIQEHLVSNESQANRSNLTCFQKFFRKRIKGVVTEVKPVLGGARVPKALSKQAEGKFGT